jgi:hypothetical protein
MDQTSPVMNCACFDVSFRQQPRDICSARFHELTSVLCLQWRTPGAQLRKASDGSEDTLSLNNAGGGNSAGSDQRNVSGGAWLQELTCSTLKIRAIHQTLPVIM